MVAECLSAAYPDDSEKLMRLRDEQMAGAATQPSANGPRVSTVMREIKVDVKPYAAAIARYDAGRYMIQTNERGALMAQANLLLLADRPGEAKALMLRMREIAVEESRYIAEENVARAIKAEDGTIGRANAWLIDPPEPPASKE